MFEVDVKKCDGTAAGKEEDQVRFGVLIRTEQDLVDGRFVFHSYK